MAGEQAVATIKGWIGAITEVALALIALAVVLQVLFGEHAVFLPGDVNFDRPERPEEEVEEVE